MSSSLHLSQFRKWLLMSPPIVWSIQRLRELLIGSLRQGPIPQHVAFVMDGNRRYARSHHIETVEGHNLGFEALARILEVCYKSGVKVVTIYAFSIENFKRSKYEVDALMDMAKFKLSQLAQHGDLLDRYGASVRVLGQRDLVKPDVIEAMDRAAEMTKGNNKAVLNVCFPYTSRDEITTAIRTTVVDYSKPHPPPLRRPFSEGHITRNIRARNLTTVSEDESPEPQDNAAASLNPEKISDAPGSDGASTNSMTLHESTDGLKEDKVLDNFPDPETITAQTLTDHMFTKGNPPLDLLIRTSGVQRLSDFMLWQCHENTEIVFLDCLWPEFDLWQFLPVLVEWQWRQRKIQDEEKGRGRLKVV
ncbi:Di-trans-poly-cis-decaprenylcistransferase-like protein [Neofusicoccum parvum]|uniref:Alkyl transferase n=3 Tax=Neofusicoccum TaxID=407951 RepID=R1GP90_BOTPV|nr:putative dehydrodolichyl diphosphate synthase protein [Neofusicoccum parvum UCRNP2]GME27745.1 Di-trans-poly-cis-decaprenylcistransferase-like protein [Neofusicoccum parvum]GME47817.1 Di-trans-poly-cis-decaprenylcistransferase-like protein [Neofusicoccum parvum]